MTTKARVLSQGWRNRIVGTGIVQAGSLLANPRNWRIHPQGQQDAMRSLLGGQIGWLAPVIVNRRYSKQWPRGERGVATVVDGHMRIQLALAQGDEASVPVNYVDLAPHEERLAIASFDRLAPLAETDDVQYDVLLADLAGLPDDLTALLARGVRKATKVRSMCACCQERCAPGCKCYRED